VSFLNDVLRFALEITGIAALAIWGWSAGGDGPLRFVLAVGAPLVLIVIWAVLIAPKSDSPLPPTPRMLVGSGLLLVAAGALWVAGHREAAAVFAVLDVVNTALYLVLPE
jgi:hypothetical protein